MDLTWMEESDEPWILVLIPGVIAVAQCRFHCTAFNCDSNKVIRMFCICFYCRRCTSA